MAQSIPRPVSEADRGNKKRRIVLAHDGDSSPDYRPSEDEEFMNPIQVEYFRQKLLRWRTDLLKEADGTLASLSEGGIHEADITDRASVETDRALELRTRDRARKLVSKIDQALAPDRERHLRLLRGDRRADRPASARGAADRHPVDRGAGTPRAHGARSPRRLTAAAVVEQPRYDLLAG